MSLLHALPTSPGGGRDKELGVCTARWKENVVNLSQRQCNVPPPSPVSKAGYQQFYYKTLGGSKTLRKVFPDRESDLKMLLQRYRAASGVVSVDLKIKVWKCCNKVCTQTNKQNFPDRLQRVVCVYKVDLL